MRSGHITSLSRSIDLSYPSNRLAVAATGVTGVVALTISLVVQGELRVGWIAAAAGGVFLAWAIGRELDPDRPTTAALAMPIALVLGLLGVLSLGIGITALIGLRIMSGSVGTRLTNLDALVVIGLGIYAGTDPALWSAAAVLVIAVLLDGELSRRSVLLAVLIASSASAAALISSTRVVVSVGAAEAVALIGSLLATAAVVPWIEVSSVADRSQAPMARGRIAASWIAAGAIAAGAGLLAKATSAGSVLAAIWAGAAVAVFITRRASDGRRRLVG